MKLKILKILRKRDKDYQADDNVWINFKKAFANAHMHFITKNRNIGNILLNSSNNYINVDTLPIEAMVKEANRARIVIEVAFKVVHRDSYQTTAKLSTTFNLSGPRKYATAGYIGDISNKAIMEWYLNDILAASSPFKPASVDEEIINGLPAARRAFTDMCNHIPDFGLDNFCEILQGIYRAFWITLASVNRYNYHIEQTSQVKNKSCEFDITFGFGGVIHFNFYEHVGIKTCDVCLYNNTCNAANFAENCHFDTTKAERLFDKKDMERLFQEFLYLANYKPELNSDICEIQFIEWLVDDIETYWKRNLQQPFLDAVFKPRTVEAEVTVLLKPSVESVNLTFNPVNTKKVEPENRPPLSDDWIRHQFNELETRLKTVESQTKGINKSCSKVHQAFENLKKEMIDLYHEKDNELKVIKGVLEKVEKRCFPEIYNANPFAHWTLNITAKRPTCDGCADDMEVGDCTNCWKCKDGSEYRPFDGKKTWTS